MGEDWPIYMDNSETAQWLSSESFLAVAKQASALRAREVEGWGSGTVRCHGDRDRGYTGNAEEFSPHELELSQGHGEVVEHGNVSLHCSQNHLPKVTSITDSVS